MKKTQISLFFISILFISSLCADATMIGDTPYPYSLDPYTLVGVLKSHLDEIDNRQQQATLPQIKFDVCSQIIQNFKPIIADGIEKINTMIQTVKDASSEMVQEYIQATKSVEKRTLVFKTLVEYIKTKDTFSALAILQDKELRKLLFGSCYEIVYPSTSITGLIDRLNDKDSFGQLFPLVCKNGLADVLKALVDANNHRFFAKSMSQYAAEWSKYISYDLVEKVVKRGHTDVVKYLFGLPAHMVMYNAGIQRPVIKLQELAKSKRHHGIVKFLEPYAYSERGWLEWMFS